MGNFLEFLKQYRFQQGLSQEQQREEIQQSTQTAMRGAVVTDDPQPVYQTDTLSPIGKGFATLVAGIAMLPRIVPNLAHGALDTVFAFSADHLGATDIGDFYRQRAAKRFKLLDAYKQKLEEWEEAIKYGQTLKQAGVELFGLGLDFIMEPATAISKLGYLVFGTASAGIELGALQIGGADDEEMKRRMRSIAAGTIRADYNMFSGIIDAIGRGVGYEPTGVLTYTDHDGRTRSLVLRKEWLPVQKEILRQQGIEQIQWQEDPANRAYEWITTIVEIGGSFLPNTWISRGMALIGSGYKATGWLLAKAGNAMLKTAQHTPVYTPAAKQVHRLALFIEQKTGLPLTAESRQTAKVQAVERRKAEAVVEMNRRLSEGTREYLFEDRGWIHDILRGTDEEIRQKLDEHPLGDYLTDLWLFKRRIQKKIEDRALGVPLDEAKQQVRKELDQADALALYITTGLPLNPDVLRVVKESNGNIEELRKKLVEMGVNWGGIKEQSLIELFRLGLHIELNPEIRNIPFDTLERVFMTNSLVRGEIASTVMPNLQLVDDILTGKFAAELFDHPEYQITYQHVLEALPLRMRKDRERIAKALTVLALTTDPIERRAIADYIAVKTGYRELSAGRLAFVLQRLGEDVNPAVDDSLKMVMTAIQKLQNEEGAEALRQVLNSSRVKTLLHEEETEALRSLLTMLERNGMDDAVINLLRCLGVIGVHQAMSIAELKALEMGEILFRLKLQEGKEGYVLKSFHTIENRLREAVREAADTKQMEVTDELLEWMNGYVSHSPAAQQYSDAVQFVREASEQMGVDFDEAVRLTGIYNHLNETMKELWQRAGIELTERMQQPIGEIIQSRTHLFTLTEKLRHEGRIEDANTIELIAKQEDPYRIMYYMLTGQEDKIEAEIRQALPNLHPKQWQALSEFFRLSSIANFSIKQESLATQKLLIGRLFNMVNKVFTDESSLPVISVAPTPMLNTKIPDDIPVVGGRFTTPYVAHILRSYSGEAKRNLFQGLDVINNYIKMAYVVWNPISLIRDTMSNMVSLLFGADLNVAQTGKLMRAYAKSFSSVKNKDEEFLKFADVSPSVWGSTTTIGQMESDIEAMKLSDRRLDRLFAWISGQRFLRNMQSIRAYSDGIGKLAMYYLVKDEIKELGGMSEEVLEKLVKKYNLPQEMKPLLFKEGRIDETKLASVVAEKYMIDYSDVSPFVQFFRRYLGILPFITYETKMAQVILGDYTNRTGWLFNQLRYLNLAQKAMAGNEEEETLLEQMRATLPSSLAYNPLTLMWRDPKTKEVKVINLSYYLPFGVLLPLQRIANEPAHPTTYLRLFTERMGSIFTPLLEVLINKDLYTGRPIVDTKADDRTALMQIGTYLLSNFPLPFMAPSLQRQIIDNLIVDPEERYAVLKERSRKWTWQDIFSIYTIKYDEMEYKELRRKLEKSRMVLRNAVADYKKYYEINPKQAEENFKQALRYANALRREAEQGYDAIFRLHYFDDGIVLTNPRLGYNPFTPYDAEINAMKEIYEKLRNNPVGQFPMPQHTTKTDIMIHLSEQAEQTIRNIAETEHLVEREAENYRQWLNANWEKSVREADEGFREGDPSKYLSPLLPYYPSSPAELDRAVYRAFSRQTMDAGMYPQGMFDVAQQPQAVPGGRGGIPMSSQFRSIDRLLRNTANLPVSMGAEAKTLKGRPENT